MKIKDLVKALRSSVLSTKPAYNQAPDTIQLEEDMFYCGSFMLYDKGPEMEISPESVSDSETK